jgi:hypothetical protein
MEPVDGRAAQGGGAVWLRRRLGLAAAEPFAVQAVMLFTRSGEGAWLLDPGGQR